MEDFKTVENKFAYEIAQEKRNLIKKEIINAGNDLAKIRQSNVLQDYGVELNDLIVVAHRLVYGEISVDEFDKYTESLIIRPYSELEVKHTIARLTLAKFKLVQGTKDFDAFLLNKASDMFFYGLLLQYGFVTGITAELTTTENYDLLYPLFAPIFLKYCRDDYNQYVNIVENYLNMTTIYNIIMSIDQFDENTLVSTVSENKSLIESLNNNKELLQILNNTLLFNNGVATNIKETD